MELSMNVSLPAEWEAQDGVLLAWPHETSDWHPVLDLVEPVFIEIIKQISRFERVLVVGPEVEAIRRKLATAGVVPERVAIFAIPSNDTWSRDFGPITVYEDGEPVLLDFGFNGWGLKFAADQDNQITARLQTAGAFGELERRVPGLILEGGSIESDGAGTLLTTAECLLGPNRNPHLDRKGIETELRRWLGAEHILWLENGYLAGDDTDSHIDTLARLCPNDTIAYVACNDERDEHYGRCGGWRQNCATSALRDGRPYRLIPLPWPAAKFDEEGTRLPATYANFLVINSAVLVPTYQDPNDAAALVAVGQAFPDRAIIGIDCLPLILQHGSLHCVTMQLPRGVLKGDE
jgi:agmatine deiminase